MMMNKCDEVKKLTDEMYRIENRTTMINEDGEPETSGEIHSRFVAWSKLNDKRKEILGETE